MRLIDANEVVENIITERDKIPYELVSEKPFKHGNSMRGGIRKALRCIEQAPTVDAVPVLRCKDCVNWDETTTIVDSEIEAHLALCGIIPSKGHICKRWSIDEDKRWTKSDDFCSYGERKEGAD